MSGCLIGLLASWTRPATAQRVDFYACVDDSTFCSESAVALVDTTCGTNFYSFRGRLAWAPLRNVGPITVSVWTRAYLTPWPLYVEIVQFNPGHSDTTCTTIYPGQVILATQGALQCEGVWETFGPLDIDHLVPRGALYAVMVEGFESPPGPFGLRYRSVGFRCIRVTAHPSALTASTWGSVKLLFR